MCKLVSWSVPTLCLDSGIVSPFWLRLVKEVCLFRCNLPPALLAEWPEPFMCHCSNTGVEWTLNKVSTQSWLWRRKFSHHFCRDSNSQPFDHECSALTNKLSRLSFPCYTVQIFFISVSPERHDLLSTNQSQHWIHTWQPENHAQWPYHWKVCRNCYWHL